MEMEIQIPICISCDRMLTGLVERLKGGDFEATYFCLNSSCYRSQSGQKETDPTWVKVKAEFIKIL